MNSRHCSDSEDRRTVHPGSGEALPQIEHPGYYPGFSTLDQQKFWDEATRRKILDRVHKIPPIQFFTPEEVSLLEAVVAHILPQDDRMPSRRIPLVPSIDKRLHEGRTPGYRFAKMPPDGEAYRLGLKAIERIATQSYGHAFQILTWREQDELLKSIHDAKPKDGATDIWEANARSPLLGLDGAGLRRGLLRPSVGLGRNWLRRPGVSSRLYAAGTWRTGTLGGRRKAL